MTSKLVIPLLAVIYVAASALTYVTFRRYPDPTGVAGGNRTDEHGSP